MDKEEAKFLLGCFRPDGADAGDDDFAEALKMAAEDREMGEWLAHERAQDAKLAMALGLIEVPSSLRARILSSVEEGFGGVPQAAGEIDGWMIGSMSTVSAPPELRGKILRAMATTAPAAQTPSSPKWWRKAAWPAAAAAGVALAILFTVEKSEESGHLANVIPANTVPVDVVQASFIRTFESPLFEFDETRLPHRELVPLLEKRKLPCAKRLPAGLVGAQCEGSRELMIDGKRGTLVCFDDPLNGRVHLVIFKRADVCGDLPPRDKPAFSQNGPWSVARWMEDGQVYVLLGSRPLDKLASLF